MLAVLLALVAAFLARESPAGARKPVASDDGALVVYTYDSFMSKHGLGPELVARFEKKSGAKIKAVALGDGGRIVSQLKLDRERGGARAHVVVGLDTLTFERAKSEVDPEGAKGLPGMDALAPAVANPAPGFVPMDYSLMAWMADTKALPVAKLPAHWRDLAKPELKRKLILEDPRTSTPGLALVAGTREFFAGREEFSAFWKSLKGQWLTIAPGWDEAYGLFLDGQAPLVWSYATSQAYHRANGDPEGRYRAIVFAEGMPVQIEGGAITRDAPGGEKMRALARDFLAFLLSEEIQTILPEKQWMMPARQGVKLPESFRGIPGEDARQIRIRLSSDAKKAEDTLTLWNEAIR